MKHNLPPNANPELFSLAAVVVGAILTDECSAAELNAIGNWLELLGQYLLTYAAQKQLMDMRNNNNNNTSSSLNQNNEIEYILKAIKKIEDELAKINRN